MEEIEVQRDWDVIRCVENMDLNPEPQQQEAEKLLCMKGTLLSVGPQ